MDIAEKELDSILSAVDRIVASNINEGTPTLGIENEIPENSILESLGAFHDQEQMYNLFYKGIQKILGNLPKGEEITKIIRNLNSTILSKRIKDKNGVRGGDSRQASIQEYKDLIDAYESWMKNNPNNLLGLALNLLNKGKELSIIPQNYELKDFLD